MMTTTTTPQQNKLFGISLLRVIAMIGVFLVHFGQRIGLTGYLRNITDFGMYGVQLFFVISGFLMLKSLDNCDTKKDLLIFYIKKLIRLLVLYYLIVLWYYISETFIFKSVPQDKYHLGWARYIFLLNGIVPADCYLWSNVGITWTIPIFFMAYLLTPLLYKLLKINNTLKLSLLLVLCVFVYFIKAKYFSEWFSFFNHYYVFVGGMLAYKAIEENKTKFIIFISIALSCFLLAINMFFSTTVTLLCIILTISTFDINLKIPFIQKTVKTLDTYSYTLYLGHGIIFCSILDKFSFNPYIKIIIAIFGTIALTFILYNCYEKPVTKFLNKKILKKLKG